MGQLAIVALEVANLDQTAIWHSVHHIVRLAKAQAERRRQLALRYCPLYRQQPPDRQVRAVLIAEVGIDRGQGSVCSTVVR